MRLLKRLLRRVLVLGLGIFTVWLIAFVFRFTDSRLPTVLALAITYGVSAYIVLRASFAWVLKFSSANEYLVSQLPGTDCPAIPLISCLRARCNSLTLPLSLPAGRRPIGLV